jgi:hypothetical protein
LTMNQGMTGRVRAESTVDQADIRGLVSAMVGRGDVPHSL